MIILYLVLQFHNLPRSWLTKEGSPCMKPITIWKGSQRVTGFFWPLSGRLYRLDSRKA